MMNRLFALSACLLAGLSSARHAHSSVASPVLTSSVTTLTVPAAETVVTWSGVDGASASDWIALFCTGGTYYYWIYATGEPAGSATMRLFANVPASGCIRVEFGYYKGGSVLMRSAPITIMPMIQQVHLSLTSDPTQMVIDFVSTGSGASPSCSYGASPSALTQTAPATAARAAPAIGNVSHALLTGLSPGALVYYSCSDGYVASAVTSFRAGAVPAAGAGAPQRVAVWADFGVNDGFGLDQIAEDAIAGAFDFALHAGDWGYDFETGNSANGNFMMNRATLYAAQQPVMPACGNHEAAGNFSQYQVRHPGVAAHSNTGSALYYSFNNGLVHYLVFNSETYIEGGIENMLNFMTADLAAVDRAVTPWVVAYSHKLWWMDATDFSKISGILQEGKVDVLFAGHWHYVSQRAAIASVRPSTPP